MAKLSFTLLLYLSLVLALAVSSNANSLNSHRRDHANLNRLIKKRAPVPQGLGGVFDGNPTAQAQSTSTPVATPNTPSPVQPTTTTPASVSSVPTTSPSASPTTSGGGLLSSVVGGILPTSQPTTDTSSTSSSTTSSSTSSSSSSTPPSLTSTQPASTPAQSSASGVYLTSSVAVSPTPTQSSTSSSSTGMSSTAMTILIIVASSVGAAVIIWTFIRKWKFSPSSGFEGRMQPIDWQPPSVEDTSFAPQRHPSNASSFHSGSNHGRGDNQKASGYGTGRLSPIPDHDFTAGPAHLAAVGGYADLARGPSAQPTMQEALARAPSMNRQYQYDQYGVPLHHGYAGY
ncbi:hypothetical protein BU15DRAFT_71523 [Melanogaster broomeanus]|nr:hypothetical protein BU15DRAFT_71523 [Melanogaster broomeanus]